MPRQKKVKLIGLGVPANLLKEFIDLSYKGNTSIAPAGYEIDTPLSDSRVKVYTKPNSKEVIVTHRGSVGLQDWLDNAKFLVAGKVKSTKTYKMHRDRHLKAIEKYGAENIIGIGHSRAALYLQELQKEVPIKEIITYNKAVGFYDALRTNPAEQTDVKVKNDFVSLLSGLQKRKKPMVEIEATKNPLDLNAAHQPKELEKLGETFIGLKEDEKPMEGSGRAPTPKTLEQLKKVLKTLEGKLEKINKGKVYKTTNKDKVSYDISYTKARIKNHETNGEDLIITKKKKYKNELPAKAKAYKPKAVKPKEVKPEPKKEENKLDFLKLGTNYTKIDFSKAVNNYIRTNDLQSKTNEREFRIDKNLSKLFNIEENKLITYFQSGTLFKPTISELFKEEPKKEEPKKEEPKKEEREKEEDIKKEDFKDMWDYYSALWSRTGRPNKGLRKDDYYNDFVNKIIELSGKEPRRKVAKGWDKLTNREALAALEFDKKDYKLLLENGEYGKYMRLAEMKKLLEKIDIAIEEQKKYVLQEEEEDKKEAEILKNLKGTIDPKKSLDKMTLQELKKYFIALNGIGKVSQMTKKNLILDIIAILQKDNEVKEDCKKAKEISDKDLICVMEKDVLQLLFLYIKKRYKELDHEKTIKEINKYLYEALDTYRYVVDSGSYDYGYGGYGEHYYKGYGTGAFKHNNIKERLLNRDEDVVADFNYLVYKTLIKSSILKGIGYLDKPIPPKLKVIPFDNKPVKKIDPSKKEEPKKEEPKKEEPKPKKEPQPWTQSGICKKIMCAYGLRTKAQYKAWIVKNHPDKGGKISNDDLIKILECANSKMYCKGKKPEIKKPEPLQPLRLTYKEEPKKEEPKPAPTPKKEEPEMEIDTEKLEALTADEFKKYAKSLTDEEFKEIETLYRQINFEEGGITKKHKSGGYDLINANISDEKQRRVNIKIENNEDIKKLKIFLLKQNRTNLTQMINAVYKANSKYKIKRPPASMSIEKIVNYTIDNFLLKYKDIPAQIEAIHKWFNEKKNPKKEGGIFGFSDKEKADKAEFIKLRTAYYKTHNRSQNANYTFDKKARAKWKKEFYAKNTAPKAVESVEAPKTEEDTEQQEITETEPNIEGSGYRKKSYVEEIADPVNPIFAFKSSLSVPMFIEPENNYLITDEMYGGSAADMLGMNCYDGKCFNPVWEKEKIKRQILREYKIWYWPWGTPPAGHIRMPWLNAMVEDRYKPLYDEFVARRNVNIGLDANASKDDFGRQMFSNLTDALSYVPVLSIPTSIALSAASAVADIKKEPIEPIEPEEIETIDTE